MLTWCKTVLTGRLESRILNGSPETQLRCNGCGEPVETGIECWTHHNRNAGRVKVYHVKCYRELWR